MLYALGIVVQCLGVRHSTTPAVAIVVLIVVVLTLFLLLDYSLGAAATGGTAMATSSLGEDSSMITSIQSLLLVHGWLLYCTCD